MAPPRCVYGLSENAIDRHNTFSDMHLQFQVPGTLAIPRGTVGGRTMLADGSGLPASETSTEGCPSWPRRAACTDSATTQSIVITRFLICTYKFRCQAPWPSRCQALGLSKVGEAGPLHTAGSGSSEGGHSGDDDLQTRPIIFAPMGALGEVQKGGKQAVDCNLPENH